ncbi:MAG: hypothetical protein IJZ00_05620 [Lachnospiraceae bacterium]|nr:hypothetical protein [Lachnospiraceae bacterium]
MQIKKVSCEQFAGLLDFEAEFKDGINVLQGKNESGKSTVVNLLSRTLFQDSKIDRRSNKEFMDNFFPVARKNGGKAGDFIDGKVVFETKNGTFALEKEWGKEPVCKLRTPDGIVKDAAAIAEILRQELLYGEGVYADLLLTTQRTSDASLRMLMDAAKPSASKKELAEAVTAAFADGDGIGTEAIEQGILEKIEELAGRHWDEERDMPAKKSGGGRWDKQKGTVLEAYYAWEDASAQLEEQERLETAVDRSTVKYSEKEEAARAAETAYRQFREVESLLTKRADLENRRKHLQSDVSDREEDGKKWPELILKLNEARKLQQEEADCKALEVFSVAKNLKDEETKQKSELERMVCPAEQEIKDAKTARKEITKLENRLCGMNLQAAVKLYGGHCMEMTILRTGEEVDLKDGAAITEAVKLCIPGVMEMELSPADVDAALVQREIEKHRAELSGILEKYKAEGPEELESLATAYKDKQRECRAAEEKLSNLPGGVSYEEAEAAAVAVIGTPGEKTALDEKIRELCNGKNIAAFVTECETKIAALEERYGSEELLQTRTRELLEELSKVEKELAAAGEIPEKYREISDAGAYLQELELRHKEAQQAREDAVKEKASAVSLLESFTQKKESDLYEEVEKTHREFIQQKQLLSHWRHILEVFYEEKTALKDNPLEDLAEKFARYVNVISGGRVASEFPEDGKFDMQIFCSERRMDYGKLSEGTKETVSLAFRLAVLEYLFPEGGGIAILDDPFANMDEERTAQSVALLKEFGARHQVIVLTCKEEYPKLLGGNIVRL